jgi:DNA segregation ATPase FtsK/SpoIIIE-like protein
MSANPEFANWELPRTDLLDDRGKDIVYDETEIKEKELEIEEKLLQFKIQVEMKGYNV